MNEFELESVLKLFNKGKTYQAIAVDLGLTFNQVLHRLRMLRKPGGPLHGRPPRSNKGFAVLPAEQRRAICSKGGKAVHAKGNAHHWTKETAQAAGRKGGLAVHAKGTAHKFRGKSVTKRVEEFLGTLIPEPSQPPAVVGNEPPAEQVEMVP